ncbi:MAG: Flp pilus assembly complex ATPase component TadA [Planctomycetes bacterium]|nr:Flp pilus assembly complex ATPase component TadA [Planctomycetota bacterium]
MLKASGIDPKALLKLLYEWEEVDQPTAQKIFSRHRKENIDVIQACLDGGIRSEAVLGAVARLLGMEMVALAGMVLPQALVEKVPAKTAREYRILPVRMDGNVLVVATCDPDNVAALDDLKFMLGVAQVRPALCSEEALDAAITQHYGAAEAEEHAREQEELMKLYNAQEVIDADSGGDSFVINPEELTKVDTNDAVAAADSAPVKKLLNLVLLTAVRAQASDVHFEPFESSFRVRNRIDGVLYEMLPVPVSLAAALVARIKVMSHLDIAERRMPQDGKIPIKIGDREVDLRVSTLPVMYGESVVIRILDRKVVNLDIAKVGFPDDQLAYVNEVINRPNGIVIVTGPTGSGKTTTLYSALSAVNEDSVKIITTEDPVEYEIHGLIQVPVDESVGRSFANCLRAILRQDPDIVLVGEARDKETAQIAIQASLTGHLVFTTLHTNDAPTAVSRLIDMGIEPFLLAATLETVIAQRLVRTICTKCKTPYEPSEEELMQLGIKARDVANQRFYYGKGCDNCKNTGYRGRTALFEIMDINDAIRELVLQKSAATQIRIAAQRTGMRSLRDAGIQKIYAGLSTIEEVVRETLAVEE